MRNTFLKLSALCAALLLAACQTSPTGSSAAQDEAPSPKNPEFTTEMAKFNAQFPNPKVSKYEEESIAFNNAQKLDERGNCHGKSKYPVTIMLLLDANGKVISTVTDVENGKAACFRQSYAAVQFPKPPIAPYRKAMLLR